MLKLLQRVANFQVQKGVYQNFRTFLSQAYYCNELWEHRLNDPLVKNVNVDELYNDLDQRFQKTRNISAVDTDIFCNAVKDASFVDELLDVMHKFRLGADACNILNSTSHAVVRSLMIHEKTDILLNALDDRINYGVFLDYYTANLMFDYFWKKNDYTSGARVASQLMLQEEFDHVLSASFALLHCYKYLLNPVGWPQPFVPEEPEEEVKIRVKYLRNPYNDDHFDLVDGNKIVGKTLAMLTKQKTNVLEKSLHVLGLTLYGKEENALKLAEEMIANKESVYSEVIKLIPDDSAVKAIVTKLPQDASDIEKLLKDKVVHAERVTSENDIAQQCKTYKDWANERQVAMERQQQRLLTAKRLSNIEDSKSYLKEKETLLWFFENEEKIELSIESNQSKQKEDLSKKKKNVVDENYIPPEVTSKVRN